MIRHRLNEALKESVKAKDPVAVRTLRLIIAALRDRDIAARGRGNTEGLSESEILTMLQTMIRQRRESIELYEQGGRLDLAQAEADEIEVIVRFLPAQLGDSEMRAAIETVVADIDAKGLKDMGRTMAELRTRYAGRMDFGRASSIVKEALG